MKIKDIKTSVGVTEASGVTRQGNNLLIVSDASPGAYHSFDVSNEQGPLILLSPEKVVRHELPGMTLAIDFESIGVLADGRVVALSERLRSLIGAEGLVLQYDDPLSELGERGLEGLAVQPGQNGNSKIAVLWEGGWVEDSEVQEQISRSLGEPFLPIVVTHEFGPGQANKKLSDKDRLPSSMAEAESRNHREQGSQGLVLDSSCPIWGWNSWLLFSLKRVDMVRRILE